MVEYDFDHVSPKMLKETRAKCSQSHFSDKSLNVEVIENGTILPCVGDRGVRKGGVVDESGKYYEQSYLHRGVGGSYEFDDSECEYFNEEVVYVGMWHDCWGHWITDNVKLLWFLFDDRYGRLKNLRFVYTVLWPEFAFSDNSKSLLLKLGIDIDQLVRITTKTKFKKIFLPDDCFIKEEGKGCWYTDEYRVLIDRIISDSCNARLNELVLPSNRVYFTRTKFKNNVDYGEERIERVFRNLGYTIISPENLTLDEQILVLQFAKVLAATEGSITHNAVFMKEGTNIVAVRKYGFVNEYQLAINEMRSLHVTYVDSHRSSPVNRKYPYLGPFFMYCSKNLSRFANCRQPLFPISSYVRYLWRYRPQHIVKKVFKRIKIGLVH